MIAELGDGILALRNLGDYFSTRHRILIYDRNFKEIGFNFDNGNYDEYIKKVEHKDKGFRIIIGNDLGGEREIIYIEVNMLGISRLMMVRYHLSGHNLENIELITWIVIKMQ